MPREYTTVELTTVEEPVLVPNDSRGLPLLFIQESQKRGQSWWQVVDRRKPKEQRLSAKFDDLASVERALVKAVR